MKRYLKRFVPVLLSLLMVSLLASCGNTATDSSKEDASSVPSETTTAATEEVRVGLLSIDDVLPIVVADKEGLFEKHGVKVSLFPFKSSSDQSKAFEAGELDIVMNDMIVQGLMKKSGTDSRVLSYAFGATPEEGRFLVVASPNSGIESPEDLYGKKVAISTNTMMDFLMTQYENHLGLDSDQIEKVNMPDLVLRMETVIAGKDVQAAILPDPLASFAVQQGCIPVIDDTQLGENFSQSVILGSTDAIKNKHDAVARFMDAYFEAMTNINENPEQYKEMALENARIPDSLKEAYQTPSYSPGKVPSEVDVERVTKWLQERGLTENVYAYDEMISKDFVK